MKITNKEQVDKLLDYNGMFIASNGAWDKYLVTDNGVHFILTDNKSVAAYKKITFPLTFNHWAFPPQLKYGEAVYVQEDTENTDNTMEVFHVKSGLRSSGTVATLKNNNWIRHAVATEYIVPTRLFEYKLPELENMKDLVDKFISDAKKLIK